MAKIWGRAIGGRSDSGLRGDTFKLGSRGLILAGGERSHPGWKGGKIGPLEGSALQFVEEANPFSVLFAPLRLRPGAERGGAGFLVRGIIPPTGIPSIIFRFRRRGLILTAAVMELGGSYEGGVALFL